jgi:hypothetical protein
MPRQIFQASSSPQLPQDRQWAVDSRPNNWQVTPQFCSRY